MTALRSPASRTSSQPRISTGDRNRLCFAAFNDIYQRQEPIDQISLARELNRTNKLSDVGGMAYLSHIISITPTSAHVAHYATIISRTSTMRRLIAAASGISAMGYSDSDDIEETLRQAENAIYSVRQSESKNGFRSLKQVYDTYLSDRADLVDPSSSSQQILSGFYDLDELIGGLQRSDVIIVGARPGLGKSTLAFNVAMDVAKHGQTAAVFSLEMSEEQLALRMLAAESGVNAHRLRLGLYTEHEENRIMDAIGTLSGLPLYIDDTPFQDVNQMRSKVNRVKLEHGLELIVVDYIQLVMGNRQSRGGGNNRVFEISEISRALKGMARDLNVALMACSQLSRVVETRPGHRPQLSDLRDSGSIEQDADIVSFIYRIDTYYSENDWNIAFPGERYPRNIAEIIVAKHRHGPTGSINLRFNPGVVRFDSIMQGGYYGSQGYDYDDDPPPPDDNDYDTRQT